MREGLLALWVGLGLKVLDELLEEELVALVEPKGRHDPERSASRHGSRGGQVVLGGSARQTQPRRDTLYVYLPLTPIRVCTPIAFFKTAKASSLAPRSSRSSANRPYTVRR